MNAAENVRDYDKSDSKALGLKFIIFQIFSPKHLIIAVSCKATFFVTKIPRTCKYLLYIFLFKIKTGRKTSISHIGCCRIWHLEYQERASQLLYSRSISVEWDVNNQWQRMWEARWTEFQPKFWIPSISINSDISGVKVVTKFAATASELFRWRLPGKNTKTGDDLLKRKKFSKILIPSINKLIDT